MSIKSITIENFKGIREPVKFDLAPITLLYGPNSAGKSTLLQAMAYLNDVINLEECNNDYTRAGGTSLKLGGFMNIVNGHDLRKSIKFSIEYDEVLLENLLPIGVGKAGSGAGRELDYSQFPYLEGTIKDGMSLDISIAWDGFRKKGYISELKIKSKEAYMVLIESKAYQGGSTIQINFEHPHFQLNNTRHMVFPRPDFEYSWKTLFDCILHEKSLLLEDVAKPMPYRDKGVVEHPVLSFDFPGQAESPDHVREYFRAFDDLNSIKEKLLEEHPDATCFDFRHFEWSDTFKKKRDAYIETDEGKRIKSKFDELDGLVNDIPAAHQHINAFFQNYFNTLITGSIQTVSNFLKEMAYIGPLRSIPDSIAIENQTNTDCWYDGMAAWAYIYHKAHNFDSDLLAELNMYLGGKDYFNTGYNVKTGNALTLEMALSGELQRLINNEGDIDLDALRKQIQDVSQFVKILKLFDLKRGVDVNVSDVGTGISQILPIILALIIDNLDVVMVEQPELHIHPRLQVQIGELLVHSLFAKGKINDRQKLHLIETHSEDLLLRLMRRVREPSAEGHKLACADLAVYYIDEVDGASKIVRRIEIDDDGDFVDEWPGGFFEESYFERFSGR